MVGALVLAIALAQAAPPPELSQHGWRVSGVGAPYLTYTPDQGIGFGVIGSLSIRKREDPQHAHALTLNLFAAERGNKTHWLRYISPWFGKRVRVDGRVEYRRERLSPFYGTGNQSAPNFTGNVLDQRFNFDRRSPGGFVRLSGIPVPALQPLQLYLAYQLRLNDVGVYPGSQLAIERPTGIEGGKTSVVWAGAAWDTRDDPNSASFGGVEELSLRYSSQAFWLPSDFFYFGVTASERRFIPLAPRWTFAQRGILDAIFGAPPFFELSTFGMLGNVILGTLEGLGGTTTSRGLPRDRYVGNVKVLSNSELRYSFLEFPLFGQGVTLSALTFVDAGRVFQNGVDDGAWYKIHFGAGGGLRAIRGGAVLRLDLGLTPEPNHYAGYANFGHVF